MTQPLFEARLRRAGSLVVLDLHGEINTLTGPDLNAAYAEAVQAGQGAVAFNFTGVSYINSTGIAFIVGLLAKARKAGQPISAFGLNDHYRELFAITRLVDLMSLYPDEASLMAHQPDPIHR